MTDSPARRCRDDAGFVSGSEVLPFGFLIFVIGTLLIANAWAVVDAKFATDAAAHEAVRAFVESKDESTGWARADQAARDTVAAHGRNPALVTVAPPDYPGGWGFARCQEVTMRVTYPVPAVSLPWIGGFGDGFAVSASSTEIIDPYRSGLGASGGC